MKTVWFIAVLAACACGCSNKAQLDRLEGKIDRLVAAQEAEVVARRGNAEAARAISSIELQLKVEQANRDFWKAVGVTNNVPTDRPYTLNK